MVAIVLGLLLALTLTAGPSAIALLLMGSLATGLYIAALARLRLLRVPAS
jgi:hypothetical protein